MRGPICELPDDPGIDGAEKQLPLESALAHISHVLEKPAYLRGRIISIKE
jgi:hypothetical protein